MVFIVVDVETTGLSPESDEIIEIGAVKWENGQVLDKFQTFVRPTRQVPNEVLALTGMDPSWFESAPTIESALPSFLNFIAGVPLAGHNVQFDIAFLQNACDACGYDFPSSVDGIDSRQLARILMPFQQSFRLQDIADALDVEPSSSHRALADAMTTANVLAKLQSRTAECPYVTLQGLERVAGFVSPMLANWFREASETHAIGSTRPEDGIDVVQQLAFTKVNREESRADTATIGSSFDYEEIGQISESLLSPDSPLLSHMPGFQVRPGQRQMVTAVVDALLTDQHLIAEAGTGTGKSLAYLIPASLYALKTNERVLVATHTIALQDQIRDRDFPTLRRILPDQVSFSVFKGRTHYICMRKLWQEIRAIGFHSPADEVEVYMSLMVWLTVTPEGNREELALWGRASEVWPRVQSETETCINKRCPFFKSCYYFRARQAAFDANVIVTNHSLILSDLKADHRVLPKYDKLVVDEAHHLEEEATKHLGDEVHLGHVLALFGRLIRDGGRHGVLPELIQRITSDEGSVTAAVKLLESLVALLPDLRSITEDAFRCLLLCIPSHQNEVRITDDTRLLNEWTAFDAHRLNMGEKMSLLSQLQNDLFSLAEDDSDEERAGRLFDAYGFMLELVGHLETLLSAGEVDERFVQWIEKSQTRERAHVSFHRAPIDVGSILSEILFDKKKTVVLTSATLSVEGRFEFVMSRLGLMASQRDGRLAALTVASPFDMPNQALLCIPSDVPELAKLTADEAALWLSDSLYQLAKASQGKLLALFTSHAMLRATANAVRAPLAKAGIELFAQGIDGSRTRILESFRNHPNGVLFGAQSFWEGIDLPGNQLTTLVIVRLPFAPPSHPVTAARHELLEREGKSSFWTASLPEAVVRFRQGFGRLIRTIEDRGVVVVYDKRIISTKYGNAFVRSLSGVKPFVAPEQVVIDKVKQFLQSKPSNQKEAYL